MNKLKVLVFDDTELHRQSARLALSGDYDLTVVSTYDEAQEALLERVDYDNQMEVFFERFGDRDPYKVGIDDSLRRTRIDFYCGEAKKKATKYPDFDIVLTDLLVPASRQAQGTEGQRFVGQEMPLGTIIALLALCAGVKKVAVVTDMNHHNHPASAAFDCFRTCKAEGFRVICTNRVGSIAIDQVTGEAIDPDFLKSEEGETKYPYLEGKTGGVRKGVAWGGKDWKTILLMLTSEFKWV